jgi:hypothetical protein
MNDAREIIIDNIGTNYHRPVLGLLVAAYQGAVDEAEEGWRGNVHDCEQWTLVITDQTHCVVIVVVLVQGEAE